MHETKSHEKSTNLCIASELYQEFARFFHVVVMICLSICDDGKLIGSCEHRCDVNDMLMRQAIHEYIEPVGWRGFKSLTVTVKSWPK